MSLTAPPRPLEIAPRAPVPQADAAPRPWRLVVVGALALGLLSLLGPAEPTYDPWAWIIWSREVTEGALSTTGGPSWKPLPVLLTAPFAFLGGDAAPDAWLVVARAGGALAVAMAYRLGARLAGRPAGVVAGVALLLADEFVRNFVRGNSEGLLVALVLFAIERHLDGRRWAAFFLAFGAALLRPEVWPFLGLYGAYLLWRSPERRLRTLAVLGVSAVVLLALWFGPEWWGSGNPLRASDRARQPNPDSAAFADHPFLEVFRRSYGVLMVPVLAGAALAVVGAVRGWLRGERGGERLAFAVAAGVLMAMVAAMTQAGYAGNLRYVALPAALLCALAGAGWMDLLRETRRRHGRRAAQLVLVLVLAASVPFAVGPVGAFSEDVGLVRDEAALYGELDAAVAASGGRARVERCGAIYTGRFDTMPLAWRLHVPIAQVGIFPYGPGTVFATRRFSLTRAQPSALSQDPRYALAGGTRRWAVRMRCKPR